MDGTLLDLHFDNYFWQVFVPQKYGQQHGLNLEESKAALYPRFHAQAGSLNWYFRSLVRGLKARYCRTQTRVTTFDTPSR